MRTRRLISLLLFAVIQTGFSAEPPGGQVVWWGRNPVIYSLTNGLVREDGEAVANAVAIAARHNQALILKSDGVINKFSFFDRTAIPPNLSNIVSIAVQQNFYSAINRNGTATLWNDNAADTPNPSVVFSNVATVIAGTFGRYLLLKKDGTAIVGRIGTEMPPPAIDPVTGLPLDEPPDSEKVFTNILSITPDAVLGLLALKRDGTVTVLSLESGLIDPNTGLSARPPVRETPLTIAGQTLTNIIALASGGGHCLALKSNGTVVAWGSNQYGESIVPAGLSNVTAIAAAEHLSLALKKDGIVTAWGGYPGQASVPAGLSNVIAIASAGEFSMAITTGAIPSSVYIEPHGWLEEMAEKADLVFKGRAVSSVAITNNSFVEWAKPHATRFQLVSILKGKPETNEVTLWHYTGQPRGWGGGAIPSAYQFETGQCYLVFAAKLERPDYLYKPPPDATNRANEYRQLYRDCVTRTLDARPLTNVAIKEAHWVELNRILNDAVPTNSLYAIECLDSLSPTCGPYRGPRGLSTENFKRERVLAALKPFVGHTNDEVAIAAISCFYLGSECSSNLLPHVAELVKIADEGKLAARRTRAIAVLSGTGFSVVSNALPRWLRDSVADVRAQAVSLLADFPGEFSEPWLRDMALDSSPNVRAVIAEAIGNGTMTNLIPTLVKLFLDPVAKDRPSHQTVDELEAGAQIVSPSSIVIGDVHASAGYALLKFDVSQVGEILKTNLSKRGFKLSFIRKLAPDGDESYLPILVQELKTHTAGSEQEAARIGFHWELSHWLRGNYAWAWDVLFKHVSAQTREGLETPQIIEMLDVLQIADDPGDARTRLLYGFLLDKGLIERAKEIRRGIVRRTQDRAINKESHGFPEKIKVFDEMDEKHSLKPGLGI